jgi:hypothetical protein
MRWIHAWLKKVSNPYLEYIKDGGLPAVFCSTFDILP